MIELKRVLFATDFSDHAASAKQMAHDLCVQFSAELHVLHVVHDLAVEVPEFGMGLAFPAFTENIGSRRKEVKGRAIKELEANVNPLWRRQHDLKLETRFGKPSEQITDYATPQNIDLIVLGSHGRTGLSHALLGSVAEKVVQHAKCPVLTIRRPLEQRESEEQPFRGGIHPLPVG